MSKASKVLAVVALVILAVIVPACSKQTSKVVPAPLQPPAQSGSFATVSMEQQRADVSESTPTTDRKIIRNGYITLEVNDIATALDEVAGIAKALDGYVVSSSKQGEEDAERGTISIRVPAARFDEAFVRLRQLAVKVPFESTESRDVTEEYTDLKAQLRNLEATESQYLELLKKAQTVEDTLKVYNALSNVRGEIERVKGRIQYLERTSDMALIQVNLQKTRPISGTGWSALQTLKSAVRGLVIAGKVLADLVIWLIVFSPIWGAILAIVLWLRRRKITGKAVKT
jgi:hypothetical protein